MTTNAIRASQHSSAKIAGFSYLFMLLGHIHYYVFVATKLAIPGDALLRANAVMANEWLFRIGLGYELLMSINLLFLAQAHCVILKSIDRNLASLAFFSVLTKAILAAVMVLITFTAIQFLSGQSFLTAVNIKQLQDIIGLYLLVRMAGHTISAVFLYLGMATFLYLLLKSRYIPSPLAMLGIGSYSIMLGYVLINVIAPGTPMSTLTMENTFDILCIVPSLLFEAIAGIWLLSKGLEVHYG